jgi:sortase A
VARRKRSAEELTVDELRQLLIEKRRSERQKRLDNYRRTGRVILVESVPSPATLNSLQIETQERDPLLEGGAQVHPTRSRVWLDRLLLLIEAAAAIGLVYLAVTFFLWLRQNNQATAIAIAPPTPSPTPLISEIVLPSGHTPPRPGATTRFNDAEIPEHLRPLVQAQQVEIALPTPSPKNAARIKIPSISVFARIVQGDTWESLKQGVGQHYGTPNPGDTGNIVLSAHNDVFGQLFRDLDKLKPGDEVILYTEQKAYTYIVRQTQIVEPTQVEVMAQTREPVITLISCYPYLVDDKRIAVTAILSSEN